MNYYGCVGNGKCVRRKSPSLYYTPNYYHSQLSIYFATPGQKIKVRLKKRDFHTLPGCPSFPDFPVCPISPAAPRSPLSPA